MRKIMNVSGKVLFLLFAVMLIVVCMPKSVQAKKVKKVTIIKGQNQAMTFRKLKIRKIKVKCSKKKIVKVKLKKDKSLGTYIRIDGKKLGKTTITVKAYTSKKKYKTLKYKVTVTNYLQIAQSKAAKTKAKKAFALQNEYREQAGVKAIEWSDEMYEYGLYRLKTSGFDKHENMWRDEKNYFGEYSYILENNTEYIGENLAEFSDLQNAVKAWKKSSGHYQTMIEDYWKCGAVVQYKDTQIAIFSYRTAEEMKNWRNYKSKYAKVVVKRQNKATGDFLKDSEFGIYNQADHWNTLTTHSVMKASGTTIYVKPGQTYVVYESMAPNGLEKAQRVIFTAVPMTQGTNEVILS